MVKIEINEESLEMLKRRKYKNDSYDYAIVYSYQTTLENDVGVFECKNCKEVIVLVGSHIYPKDNNNVDIQCPHCGKLYNGKYLNNIENIKWKDIEKYNMFEKHNFLKKKKEKIF